MKLDEFFPHQVCINLDTRPDRWKRITARFIEHSLGRVIRFPAVDGKALEVPPAWRNSPGAYGCLRSHLAVVEQARDQARPSVLIFEDDTVLAPKFGARFAMYVRQLPDDWDLVFFGCLHGQPLSKVADNVIKVEHSLSTYAYALRNTIYDAFIELNRKALTVLDENTRALQKQFNCYCFMPHLAWVEEDRSDIREEMVDLWWLRESLVLFGPEIDDIMKSTVAVISYRNQNPGSFRNLLFTIDQLAKGLPGITLLILEPGQGPRLNPGDIPFKGDLDIARNSGRNRDHSLNKVCDRFDLSKGFFIFLDSDVYLTREDIRANLLKCRDYDIATSFHEIFELNERDTLRILKGDDCWNYDSPYRSHRKASIYDSSFIATRKGLRILMSREKSGLENEDQLSLRERKSLRVYDSPNRARRLASL